MLPPRVDLSVDLKRPFGCPHPAELIGPHRARSAQPLVLRPASRDDRFRERLRIGGVSKDRGTACRLGHRASVRGDDGARRRHGLQNRQAEGLVERRVHEQVGRPVEVHGLFERHSADPDDVVGDAELVGECSQLVDVLHVAPRADHGQLAAVEPALCQSKRLQQAAAVLVGPERRHEQYEPIVETVADFSPTLASSASPGLNSSWSTASGIKCSLAGSTKVLLHLAAQALGVDDDRVGDPGRPRIARPAVEPNHRTNRFRRRVGVDRLEVDHA